MRIQKLPYLVAIVIPSLGRTAAERLTRAQRNVIIQTALKRFEELFGGATPMRIPPGGIVRLLDGTVLVDPNQTLVVSGTTRREFLRRREEIERLALRVGEMSTRNRWRSLLLRRTASLIRDPARMKVERSVAMSKQL